MEELPFVLQYNKRDVPGAIAVEHLDLLLNQRANPFPTVEAVAAQGYNVFATLNAVAEEVLQRFHVTVAGVEPDGRFARSQVGAAVG